MDRLIVLLNKAYDGDPWHGPSLKSVLEGVDAKSATARPHDSVHTIWELVLHLNSWYREVGRRLKGSPPSEPVEGDWPETADGSEVEWARALAALVEGKDTLVQAVKEFPEERWDDLAGDASAGTGVTYFEMVEGVLQHCAYHAGQITALRRINTGK